MESDNNYFIQRDKQVEAMSSPVDFGLGEERWQHPELGAKWMNYLKGSQKEYRDNPQWKRQVSEMYNREVLNEIMLKNPDEDYEFELNNAGDALEDNIIKYHGLKNASEITPELKREYIAAEFAQNRFDKDLTTGAYGRVYGLADYAYNKKEVDPFAYVPKFQQTTPSRASMLNTGQQNIDTSVPAFLQVRNPFFKGGGFENEFGWNNPLVTNFLSKERLNPNAQSFPDIFSKRVEAFNQIQSAGNSVSSGDVMKDMRDRKALRDEVQKTLLEKYKRGDFSYPSER